MAEFILETSKTFKTLISTQTTLTSCIKTTNKANDLDVHTS